MTSHAVLVLSGVAVAQATFAQEFRIIRPPDGGEIAVTEMTEDGRTLVGPCSRPGYVESAFRWRATGGWNYLDDLPGGQTQSYATGVAEPGTVVVGIGHIQDPIAVMLRWTGLQVQPIMFNANQLAFGVPRISGDGNTIVASLSQFGSQQPGISRLRNGVWVNPSLPGSAVLAGDLIALSFDGEVVVFPAIIGQRRAAMRWDQSGVAELPDLPGGQSYADRPRVSSDGQTVVGVSSSFFGTEAFRWTAEYGTQRLGQFQDSLLASAQDVNADGSVVVGDVSDGQGAFLWSHGHAFLISHRLSALGVSTQGYAVANAAFVSGDGRIVVGTGTRAGTNYVWWADLGTVCPTDWNDDAGVDADDVIAFFYEWDRGRADFNMDGGTDADDVIGFFERWDAGC